MPAASLAAFGEIDDDHPRLALHIVDGDGLSITGLQLSEQGQGVVVITKAHRLARHQRVESTENRGMAKAFGNAARIEGLERVLSRLVASVHENLLKYTKPVGTPLSTTWRPAALM